MPLTTIPSSGLNLGFFAYFTAEHPFANVSNQDFWHRYSGGFGAGSITLDSNGEVTAIAVGSTARKSIFKHNGQQYPTGLYRLECTGDINSVRCVPDSSNTEFPVHSSGSGYKVYTISSTAANGFCIEITTAGPTKVKLFPPFAGIDTTASVTDKFRPGFLTEVLAEHGIARFMDWGLTNNSLVEDWSDRTTLDSDYWGETSNGIPFEMMIDLCNEAELDCWICVPHKATDDYVEELATLVDVRLDSGLKFWIEYSNECWNWGFAQFSYCNDVLKPSFGLSNVWQAYGKRAGQVIKLAKDIIADDTRIVGVVAGQNAGYSVLANALPQSRVSNVQMANVAAVAPYFNLDGTSYTMNELYADYLAGTVDEAAVFAALEEAIDGSDTLVGTAANYEVIRSHGLTMVAYEGGQHLAAYGEKASNAGFVNLLADINRDSRMGGCYAKLLDGWYDEGGKSFVLFNDILAFSVVGYWGLMENYTDTSAAKYLAVQDYYDGFADTLTVEATSPVGLIHHYKLDEVSGTTAADSGSSPVAGTYQADASTLTTTGPGTAITKGTVRTTGYTVDVVAAAISSPASTVGSFSGWLKGTPGGSLVGDGGANVGTLHIQSSTVIRVTGQFATIIDFTVPTLSASTWYHILFVKFANNTARLWLNGVESSSGSLAFSVSFAPRRLLGTNTNTTTGSWIKVFNTDESANVLNLYAEKDLPVITSNGGGGTASISIAENTTAVTTVVATNLGADITYAITGGADAALFSLGASSGVLAFLVAPDYESPADADANNQYIVEVTASGPGGTDSQVITVTVTDEVESPVGGGGNVLANLSATNLYELYS